MVYFCNQNLFKAYDDDKCGQIAGTPNIQWTLLSTASGSPPVGCAGIEFTDLIKGLDSVSLKGTGVSNTQCLGLDEYTLTRTTEPNVINAGTGSVEMTFRREAEKECFTGHWISGGYDYLAYIDISMYNSILGKVKVRYSKNRYPVFSMQILTPKPLEPNSLKI